MRPIRDTPEGRASLVWIRRIGFALLACVPIATASAAVPTGSPVVPSHDMLQAGPSCPAGQTLCGSVCTNVSYDPQNCGRCGSACPAGIACTAGACSCPPGLTNCSGHCTNTTFDPQNCGGCGASCALPHASSFACVQSTCAVVTCATGFANCDGAPANGCEANLATDAKNCGACGVVCAMGCAAGHCRL